MLYNMSVAGVRVVEFGPKSTVHATLISLIHANSIQSIDSKPADCSLADLRRLRAAPPKMQKVALCM